MRSLLALVLLAGCAAHTPHAPAARPAPKSPPRAQAASRLPPIPLAARLALPPLASPQRDRLAQRVFSFEARNVDVRAALAMFARAYRLNVVPDPDVHGRVSVSFHDLPLREAMDALLAGLDLSWEREGEIIRVHAWETRTFAINYIRLVRSAAGASEASATTGTQGEQGNANQASGAIRISQEDTVRFWDELEKQLARLVSKEGRFVVNRMAGIVQVTERHSRMRRIEEFLTRIARAVARQVLIEVKIVEVELNNSRQLGIDWSRVNPGTLGTRITFTLQNVVQALAGGAIVPDPSMTLRVGRITPRGGDINAVIQALAEQGKVRVISQPRVRTLNNQPAMIKVGVDRTFFRREQSTTTGTATTTAFTDVPEVVTEGIVLTITPQIADDGSIIMDISPVITRIANVTEVRDAQGAVVASAPNVEVRQASSIVRARDGSTIVLGGLIQTTRSTVDRGVPLLKDLPLLGAFFRSTARVQKRTELVIFITPHLVDAGGAPWRAASL